MSMVAAFVMAFTVACSSSEGEPAEPIADPSPTEPTKSAPGPTADAGGDATTPSGGTDASSEGGEVGAADLVAITTACAKKVSSAPYARDVGGAANIDVCGLTGAVFWKADMDIDCDGKPSATCSKATDPSFLAETAASDSKGQPLDAAKLPYVVVPLPSSRFDYRKAGLRLGNVVAVVYDGKVEYGVIGDLGPASIIGEASYAMAKKLGIDPNPAKGGTGSGVLYIAFTGTTAKIAPIEDHTKAVTSGRALAKKLVTANKQSTSKSKK